MTYGVSDTESANERRPILGGRADSSATKAKKSSKKYLSRLAQFFDGGIFGPDASTYEPIEILLNAEDGEERDRLTEKWRDNRLSELSFVGVVVR